MGMKLEKVIEEYNKMDKSFFKKKVDELTRVGEECDKKKDHPSSDIKKEIAILEYELIETKYNGYEEIVNAPEMIDEISKNYKEKIQNIQSQISMNNDKLKKLSPKNKRVKPIKKIIVCRGNKVELYKNNLRSLVRRDFKFLFPSDFYIGKYSGVCY